MKFKDDDRYGDLTFLDILEDNDVPFIYDGKELTFLHNAHEAYATQLWQGLTGHSIIGDQS